MEDHESVINKPLCLSLNSNWSAIGWLTIKQAIIAMTGGLGDSPPALGLNITISQDGELQEAYPVKWEEWIKLPVRPDDLSILTRSGAIRAPMVVVRPAFGKMLVKQAKLGKRAIYDRDGGICAYTGEKVDPKLGNIDHVIPRDRGGKNTWENMVWSRKDINFKKGNKLNHEAGLVLLRTPKAPKPMPVSFFFREPRLPVHAPFVK